MKSYRQIKRTIILLLSLLGLQCAGIGGGGPQEGQLYVGWAGRSITPNEPVALSGQFYLRIAREAANPITCTVLAIETREGEKVIEQAVMVSCDPARITKEMQEKVRETVKARLPGLPARKIFLNATHTHSAPVIEKGSYDIPKEGVMQPDKYVEFLTARVAEAVVEAWNRRKPAALSWALGQAVIGYNRRVVYSRPQSGWIGAHTSTMYGKTDADTFRGIEGYEDHGVEMLLFWDDNEKLTGILINVTCPSQQREQEKQISADFWHDARAAIRKRHGEGLFIFAQCGAAGDQSPHRLWRKAAEEEMLKRKGITNWQEAGLRIARAVDEVMPYAKKDIRKKVVFRHMVDDIELPRRMLQRPSMTTVCETTSSGKTSSRTVGRTGPGELLTVTTISSSHEWRFLKRHSSFSIALVWFLILGSVCALALRLAVHFCQAFQGQGVRLSLQAWPYIFVAVSRSALRPT
ncbi:MAG: hypothetical protein ACYTEQ_27185, partial [Planctomycetota bacterium]